MKAMLLKIAQAVNTSLCIIGKPFLGDPGSVHLDNDIALRVTSTGGNRDTQIFTPGGEEIICWTDLKIEDVNSKSGIIHATIRVEVRLGQ